MAIFGSKDVSGEISKIENELRDLRSKRDKNQAEAFRKTREASYYRTLPQIPEWGNEKSLVVANDLDREVKEHEKEVRKLDSQIANLQARLVDLEEANKLIEHTKSDEFLKEGGEPSVSEYARPSDKKSNFISSFKRNRREKEALGELFKGTEGKEYEPEIHPAKYERKKPLPVIEGLRRLESEQPTEPRIAAGMKNLFGEPSTLPQATPKKTRQERIEELQEKLLEAQEKLAEKQLEAAGGGGEGGKQTLVHGPKQEVLAGLQAEPLRAQKELKEGLKHETKPLGYALVSAAPIVIVSYFVLNNWIALAVNWLPSPIGGFINSMWFVSYLIIYLLGFAMLSQIKSPATIVMSGVLTTVIIGLVFGVLLNIFVDFLGPFLGPGLTCTLAQTKALQQGGSIPPECAGQPGTPTADKTGGTNLLSASIGQSGVPFPTPRPGYTYQFPITISNPSDFDVGPVVIEGGYMCGKSGGYPTCGSYDNNNNFVPSYRMTSNGCTSDSNNCVVSVGGPPLMISVVGGDKIPDSFKSSYVSLYVNVRYPFKTSGTNDYYITKTSRDVPKTIQACEGSGTRTLGKACTGSGPLNVIPYFSESYLSMDQFDVKHDVALTVAVSNVGDGTARIKSIDISRLSTALNIVTPDGKSNCHLTGTGIEFGENNLHAQEEFFSGEPAPLTVIGQEITDLPENQRFDISSGETVNFICDYTVDRNQAQQLLTGPYTSVKFEAKVDYYYYETASKNDILAGQ